MTTTQAEEPKKGKLKKWAPKRWRPEYDRIVAYSVLGKANTWIAEQMDFTPEHVSAILNCPDGIRLATKLQMKLQDNIEKNVPDLLSEIAQKAAERVRSVLFNDELFEKNPFAVIDRGMDVLKGLGHLRGGGNGAAVPQASMVNEGTIINITSGQRSDLLDGLQMVADVKRLHGSSSGNGTP